MRAAVVGKRAGPELGRTRMCSTHAASQHGRLRRLAPAFAGSRVSLAGSLRAVSARAACEGGPAVPDVSSCAPAGVRLWVALDVHKRSIVAATLPPVGGRPEIIRVEHTRKAIGRLIDQLGGPGGLAVADEAGPAGWGPQRVVGGVGGGGGGIAPPPGAGGARGRGQNRP